MSLFTTDTDPAWAQLKERVMRLETKVNDLMEMLVKLAEVKVQEADAFKQLKAKVVEHNNQWDVLIILEQQKFAACQRLEHRIEVIEAKLGVTEEEVTRGTNLFSNRPDRTTRKNA